jgi:hypothetical protein
MKTFSKTRPVRKARPGLEPLERREVPAIFTVTSKADVVNPIDGVTTLREAILAANANPGPDVINFNIPVVGLKTIRPLTALPEITGTVFINGYSQPGSTPNTLSAGFGTNASLRIELNGGLLKKGESGLVLTGRGSVVRGLVINGFCYPDVGDPGSQRYVPAGGLVLLGQGGHVVQGNFIGTAATGLTARPNQFQGVYVASRYNLIGGGTAAARNLISGNQGFGVHISARDAPGGALHTPAEYNRVVGNLIGTNRFGTAAVANTGAGVMLSVFAWNNTIGGPTAAFRNVISGNGGKFTPFGDPAGPYQGWPDAPFAMSGGHGSGIHIESLTSLTLEGHAVPNSILNNYIGTNAMGTAALPNKFRGVTLVFTNRVTMKGNLISGNRHAGVVIGGTGATPLNNRLEFNRIGTVWTGLNPLGNGAEGIDIGAASRNTIYRNTIAYNGATGVAVSNEIDPKTMVVYESVGNRISENSIHSNKALGIDLVKLQGLAFQYGPTLNDALDADQGPNGFQNYPTILLAKAGPLTRVRWTMNSLPNTMFRLEFFVSAARDPSGFGEGTRHLVTLFRPTNASGNMVFDLFLPAPTLPGQWLTMTATDEARGNTSEFSRAVRLS